MRLVLAAYLASRISKQVRFSRAKGSLPYCRLGISYVGGAVGRSGHEPRRGSVESVFFLTNLW